MPLFHCSQCGCIENTALGAYWYNKAKGKPVLCSECDTGKWHGRFPKTQGEIRKEDRANPNDVS
jgi:hypothetical protein